jgi:hypothetical protein
MNEEILSAPSKRRLSLMWVLWPSFLGACVLEALIFVFVNPADLSITHVPHHWSATSVYSISFFVLWVVTVTCCATTAWLTALDIPQKPSA